MSAAEIARQLQAIDPGVEALSLALRASALEDDPTWRLVLSRFFEERPVGGREPTRAASSDEPTVPLRPRARAAEARSPG